MSEQLWTAIPRECAREFPRCQYPYREVGHIMIRATLLRPSSVQHTRHYKSRLTSPTHAPRARHSARWTPQIPTLTFRRWSIPVSIVAVASFPSSPPFLHCRRVYEDKRDDPKRQVVDGPGRSPERGWVPSFRLHRTRVAETDS